jgi:two-component system chemotaxis sensor kinase CheA
MELCDADRDVLTRLFFEESEEGLLAMEHALLMLEETPADAESLSTLFRVAHTLKGNAGSLGFVDLAAMTHGLEDVLDRLRGGSLAVSRDVVDLLLTSLDILRQMLTEARG